MAATEQNYKKRGSEPGRPSRFAALPSRSALPQPVLLDVPEWSAQKGCHLERHLSEANPFGFVAVVFIGAWATYSWRGPRGGWRATDLLVFASSVVLIYGAAACLGWWGGRSMRQTNA